MGENTKRRRGGSARPRSKDNWSTRTLRGRSSVSVSRRSRGQRKRRKDWKSSLRKLKMRKGRRLRLPGPRKLRRRTENTKRRRGGSARPRSKDNWNTSNRGRLIWRRGNSWRQQRRRRKGKLRPRGEWRRRRLTSRGNFASSREKPPWKSCKGFADNLRPLGRISPRSWQQPQPLTRSTMETNQS